MPISFHFDEHISGHIVAALRRRNIDVTTMIRRLILVHDLLSPEEMAVRVEFL